MSVRIVQNNFVSGEVAPELWGRHDIKAYFQGAAQIMNFIARRTGGLRKRPGTNLLYELTAGANHLGNRYFAFPYLFDSTSGAVVYLYASGSGTVKSIYAGMTVVNGQTVTPIAPVLLDISTTLNITTEAQIASLRSKQIGDTLFFTRNRKSAFKCAVTYSKTTPSASTLAFTMLTPTTSIPIPEDMSATAHGFKSYDVTGTDPTTGAPIRNYDGYRSSEKKYALYGIKSGILSAPLKRAVAMQMPWSAGAYVELSFKARWDLYDSYILGKLNGYQYGTIGEFYPDTTQSDTQALNFVSAVPPLATFKERLIDGAITYLAAPWDADTGPTGADAKLKSDPDKQTADTIDLALSEYASIYQATAGTGVRTVILPQCVFASGFAGGTARICLGGTVRNSNGQEVVAVSYAGMALRVTPFNYTADGLTFYPAQDLTVAAGDYLTVPLPLWNGSTGIKNTYGPTEADPLVIEADGAVKHIGFKVEYLDPLTGTRDARIDDGLVLNGMAFDTSGTFGTALVACTASDSFVYFIDPTAPEASYAESAAFLTTPVTCAWNKYTGTAYTAIGAAPRYASFTDDTLVTIEAANGSYHANSMIVKGDVYVKWNGGVPAAIQIWPGAIMQHLDGTPASASPETTPCTMTLYQQKNAGTWHELGNWTIPKTYWISPATKDIDTIIEDPSNNFKITFSEKTVIRGLALVTEGRLLVFKDDNIAAGTLTGIQTRLTVGDSNMDCRVMDLWEQRLVMASSDTLPFTMWFSAVGDLYNFYANSPQVDSDAFSVTIPATKASKILHTISGKWLTVFTESGEYVVSSSGGEGFSYRTIQVKKVSSVGIHPDVEPVETEDRMVFVAHDGRAVYEMRYDLQQDSVIPIDRSLLAYHLTEQASIVKAAYQRFPDSVVWFLLSDGTLLSMTFTPDQDVIAWARHTIAQPAGFTGTLKLVNIFSMGSVATGTGVETTSDIILQFDVFDGNGARTGKTYIERMRPHVCVDLPENNAARCSDHIGIASPPAVNAKVITLRPESPDFNTMGLPKNVQEVTLRVRRAHTVSVKPSDASLSAVTHVCGTTGASNTSLFSGDVEILPRGCINYDGQLEIASSNNMPCEILSMICQLEVKQ